MNNENNLSPEALAETDKIIEEMQEIYYDCIDKIKKLNHPNDIKFFMELSFGTTALIGILTDVLNKCSYVDTLNGNEEFKGKLKNIIEAFFKEDEDKGTVN